MKLLDNSYNCKVFNMNKGLEKIRFRKYLN